MVMPEIGFDEFPSSPTIRAETVAKKNPKRMMRTAEAKLPWAPAFTRNASSAHTPRTITSDPAATKVNGRSREVRSVPAAATLAPRSCLKAELKALTIVGTVRPSVISPDMVTAPAPI